MKGVQDAGSTGINTCMSHKHHIIPKHMGGTDDPSNLIVLSVDEHADAHKQLYEQYGLWQDYVAWQGLAKLAPKEELVRRLQSEGGKKCRQMYPNPFTGIRTESNFVINNNLQQKAVEAATTSAAMEKRKQTFAKQKHQQNENNSQFGKVWCVEEIAIDLTGRKKYHKEQVPKGWITTTEWSNSRKNKNSNAYGRHWYNDSKKNYYLKPDDKLVTELSLSKGRLNCSFKKL